MTTATETALPTHVGCGGTVVFEVGDGFIRYRCGGCGMANIYGTPNATPEHVRADGTTCRGVKGNPLPESARQLGAWA